MIITNKILVVNKVDSVESNDKLIKKSIESKTRKLFKSEILSKFKKPSGIRMCFYIFKASFTNI